MDAEQQRARDILDDILQVDGGLRASEIDFIEDMDTKRNLEWTEPQIDWLDQIYKRVC